jgi:hypothetical protein
MTCSPTRSSPGRSVWGGRVSPECHQVTISGDTGAGHCAGGLSGCWGCHQGSGIGPGVGQQGRRVAVHMPQEGGSQGGGGGTVGALGVWLSGKQARRFVCRGCIGLMLPDVAVFGSVVTPVCWEPVDIFCYGKVAGGAAGWVSSGAVATGACQPCRIRQACAGGEGVWVTHTGMGCQAVPLQKKMFPPHHCMLQLSQRSGRSLAHHQQQQCQQRQQWRATRLCCILPAQVGKTQQSGRPSVPFAFSCNRGRCWNPGGWCDGCRRVTAAGQPTWAGHLCPSPFPRLVSTRPVKGAISFALPLAVQRAVGVCWRYVYGRLRCVCVCVYAPVISTCSICCPLLSPPTCSTAGQQVFPVMVAPTGSAESTCGRGDTTVTGTPYGVPVRVGPHTLCFAVL